MKRILALAALMILALGITAPVAAQADPAAKQIREDAKARAEERKQTATDKIAGIKVQTEEHKAKIKQDVCENRKTKLNDQIENLSRNAANIKGVIDRMYDRVQGFYEDGQLTVSNYNELVEAIELAKANSETSLEALASYEFEVDCDSSTVAESMDSYRTAAKQTRDDLKDYRKALVDLISSLKAEAGDNTVDNSGGDSTEDQTDDNSNDNTGTAEPTETGDETNE